LGYDALYRSINFDIPSDSPSDPNPASVAANQTAIATRVDLFVCPSEERRQLGWPGNTNYAVNFGASPWTVPAPRAQEGAFVFLQALGSSSYPDGLSTTAAFSERLKGDGLVAAFDRRRDVWHPPNSAGPNATADETLKICSSFSGQYPGMEHYSWVGLSWFYHDYQNTYYNHVAPPNSTAVSCDLNPPPMHGFGSYPARSLHGGGVNVSMMGGSTRFVSDRIDLRTWRALSTRAGGEIVGAF
jgi:hypothetical protein